MKVVPPRTNKWKYCTKSGTRFRFRKEEEGARDGDHVSAETMHLLNSSNRRFLKYNTMLCEGGAFMTFRLL